MEVDSKVFASNILRANNNLQNNLYDLLEIEPAQPVPESTTIIDVTCSFVPKNDKYYVPKKKLKLKVKTVRQIREMFEKDVYTYLPGDLEKQRNILFRKIRCGSSREDNTKKMVINMLSNGSPIPRDIWQMMMNLNPLGQKHVTQYVRWNGRNVQICGSRGGTNEFLCKFDIGNLKYRSNKRIQKRHLGFPKKNLLRDSLIVNFKPGPLSKKKYLDNSFQKFQFGSAITAKLPMPVLDIEPILGVSLDPVMNKFVCKNFMQDTNGKISDKWAEFATCTLGEQTKGGKINQKHKDCITFNLDYACHQNNVLARRNTAYNESFVENNVTPSNNCPDDLLILSEVKTMLKKIIDSVEISLNQNNMFLPSDDAIIDTESKHTNLNNISTKEKNKKRCYGELERLDVTVIKLTQPGEILNTTYNINCQKPHCLLGCICESLDFGFKLRSHCGQIQCMFQCQCKFSKIVESLSDGSKHIMDDLIHLDNNNKLGLAKEEQKFRQTVILSGDKSMFIKSQRRELKPCKRYEDFYTNKKITNVEEKLEKKITITVPKLSLDNVEPWCMIHNLYKCFCKGKFTECAMSKEEEILAADSCILNIDLNELSNLKNHELELSKPMKTCENSRVGELASKLCLLTETEDNEWSTCARVRTYYRLFSPSYYAVTNRKIAEMEKNDKSLQKKLLRVQGLQIDNKDCTKYTGCEDNQQEININNIENDMDEDLSTDVVAYNMIGSLKNIKDTFPKPSPASTNLFKDPKVVAWLGAAYKQYKEQMKQGIIKTSLEPPQLDKPALLPWDFILNRYREKKNLFLISKVKPYRTFIAVSTKHPFFNNCMNINDINISELQNYPNTVRNLLTNETELKDSFCILFGLSYCWELIASLTYNRHKRNALYRNDDSITTESEESCSSAAIHVSRVSEKTVRLSSQMSRINLNDPQFGIYAIPNMMEQNVFIGPYEKDEPLGVETIKLTSVQCTNKTRGVWITVDKVDNVKIIDQPLSLLPANLITQETIPLESDAPYKTIEIKTSGTSSCAQSSIANRPIDPKIVKPIKIQRSSTFYPTSFLSLQTSKSQELDTVSLKHSQIKSHINIQQIITDKSRSLKSNKTRSSLNKPVAEIAPQVKTVLESESPQLRPSSSRMEKGMFILKPEEINRKSFFEEQSQSLLKNDDLAMDIENFLVNSDVCKPPESDICIISDDDDDVKDVWVQSKNIQKLGWIPAKQREDGSLSFKFPGFQFTQFYTEEEAFNKISLVFTRKVYVPKNINFEWEVVQSRGELLNKNALQSSDLCPDLIMTSRGLKHKSDVINCLKRKQKLEEPEKNTSTEMEKRLKIMDDLDDFSNLLEEESNFLLNKTVNSDTNLINALSVVEGHRRREMSERLSTLLSDST
ncbi:unnamed protein product [Leptidea sinapis]|uniref:MGA conserved domain-containing protein n=1 Tax=Leptidea sinapis TaxID=189913 RepID=A0A5E4PUN2_9NEOP|nr:unnamed protein product [Leptidea sinapis]